MPIKLKNMQKANIIESFDFNDIDDSINNGINHNELEYNYFVKHNNIEDFLNDNYGITGKEYRCSIKLINETSMGYCYYMLNGDYHWLLNKLLFNFNWKGLSFLECQKIFPLFWNKIKKYCNDQCTLDAWIFNIEMQISPDNKVIYMAVTNNIKEKFDIKSGGYFLYVDDMIINNINESFDFNNDALDSIQDDGGIRECQYNSFVKQNNPEKYLRNNYELPDYVCPLKLYNDKHLGWVYKLKDSMDYEGKDIFKRLVYNYGWRGTVISNECPIFWNKIKPVIEEVYDLPNRDILYATEPDNKKICMIIIDTCYPDNPFEDHVETDLKDIVCFAYIDDNIE